MLANKSKKAHNAPATSKKLAKSNSFFDKYALNVTEPGNRKYCFALALIVLVSFIAYLPVLHNSFVDWDDEPYLQNNPLIHFINIRKIFSSFVIGNYHPLTILIYSVEYHFFGLSEQGFHAVNLLFHLLNVILVFRAVFLLSNKPGVALTASLLFGIHPMHVESVAWVSELKDLLYVFFFLASYIYYLRYLKNRRRKFYCYCLLLFLLSLLSKAMAVSFPFVLLLTDSFKERKIDRNSLLEKISLFVLSLIFGVVAVFAQHGANAIHVDFFTFPQRIVFASYGFITYLVKLLLPLDLCAFYPYPIKSGASIPFQYYIYVPLLFGLAACVWYSLRFTKKILFGMGFFAITVFLVLQLLPVGDVIMADRYSYLPSIGIFYLAGEGIVFLWNKRRGTRYLRLPAILLLGTALVFYSVKTWSQCGIWKNSLSLWNDVISRYQTISTAYINRGIVLFNLKRYEEGLSDFNKAIELKPDYATAYNNRGNVLNKFNKYEEAMSDYNIAIELKPDFAEAYGNRGILLEHEKREKEALSDFNKAIQLKPDYEDAYCTRGNLY